MNHQLADRHFHWVIQSGTPIPEGTGPITNYTEITVIGYFTPEEAIEAAKQIMPGKDMYHVGRVYECNTCRFQQDQLETLQKFARGHE